MQQRKLEEKSSIHDSSLSTEEVFENIQDGVLILDTKWRYVYVNKLSETLAGKTKKELLGKVIWEVFPGSVEEILYKKYHEAVRTRKTVEVDYFSHATRKWFTIHAYPSKHGLTILFSDITEKKIQSERQLLLDSISDLLTTSLDHKITLQDISQRIVPAYADYCRVVLTDEHKHTINITAQHIDPEKVSLVQNLYKEYRGKSSMTIGVDHILATGKPELMTDVEKEAPLASLKSQPNMQKLVKKLELKSYMGVPLQARGRILGVITFSSTQTGRHYTKDDLHFAQQIAERISTALDNARLYTSLQESQNNLLFLAQASKLLSSSLDYHITLQEVAKIAIPHVADWCGVDMLDDHGQLKQLAVAHKDPKKVKWAKAFRRTHQPDMSEMNGVPVVIKTKKSVLYPLITDEMLVATAKNKRDLALTKNLNITSVMIVPIISKESAIGALSFVTTEGKRQYSSSDLAMAEELAHRAGLAIENALLYLQAQKEIEERKKLEKQKDEFIGVASHELKTPVTSIKSFAQVLRLQFSKEGNIKAADMLGKLDAQVDKLTSLISDLLDVTKIESGRMQFTQEYFSFDELVNELIEELQRTTEKHSLIRKGKTKKIVYGDRERVGQVLTNLISNAIKYSPHTKTILIHLSTQKRNVKLCVQDFGVGIPRDKLSQVFERFFRVSGPRQETYPGLGLGLYVSSEIIKRLQGKIWVESTVGKGSTFCFTLPLKQKKMKHE